MDDKQLTSAPIPGLIANMALPAGLGLFFNTMFNVVDTFYTRFISASALAGLTLSFPLFLILLAVGNGLGAGVQALAANAAGAGDKPLLRRIATSGLLLGILFSLLLTCLGYLIAPSVFRLMGASGAPLEEGLRYIQTIVLGLLFFVVNNILNGILSSQGDTKSYRNFLIIGFLLNLLLDPLFILVLPLGTAGIALATVLIQIFGTIYLLAKLRPKSPFIPPEGSQYRRLPHYWPEILHQSLPPALNMMTIALGVFIINFFLLRFGADAAVAGYGAAIRVEQIILLPAIGLNIALLTLIGQNYGARRYDRVIRSFQLSMRYGLIIMAAGGLLLFIFRQNVVGFFNQDPAVIKAGASYLAIEVFVLPSYIFLYMGNSVLQGLKKPALIFWVGLYRQIVMPPILFYLFGELLGLGTLGVWLGIGVTCWSGGAVTYFYTRHVLKERGCLDCGP